jgi:hypothetical protein
MWWNRTAPYPIPRISVMATPCQLTSNEMMGVASLDPSYIRLAALQPVDDDKQQYPHHVHEVPVPGGGFEGKVVVLVEVAFE